MLAVLDGGLDYISSARASVAAYQSRLDSALDIANVTTENIASARSQIMDTDVASETAELTRNQILQQAGVSILAQANTQLSSILQLLKF